MLHDEAAGHLPGLMLSSHDGSAEQCAKLFTQQLRHATRQLF
jgi:hypothetical protein